MKCLYHYHCFHINENGRRIESHGSFELGFFISTNAHYRYAIEHLAEEIGCSVENLIVTNLSCLNVERS